MSMNFKEKFTGMTIGAVLLTTVSTSALATKPGEHHHPKPPQTPDITIPVQVNGGSPKGGDAYANGGKSNSSSDARADADASAVSQSGALSQSGANAQTGPSSSSAQGYTGGNNFSTHSDFRAGAITGAPGMGFLMAPDKCSGAFGISLGGGAPFMGSGGIGVQMINPAGLKTKDGISLIKIFGASDEDRAKMTKDFSNKEHEVFSCLEFAWNSQVLNLNAQAAMANDANTTAENIEVIRANKEIKIAKINSATQQAMPGIRHFCYETVVMNGKGQPVPHTMPLRGAGHEKCEELTWKAVNHSLDTEVDEIPKIRERGMKPVQIPVPSSWATPPAAAPANVAEPAHN